MAAKRDAELRFQEKYIPEPNSGCWLWTGCVDKHGHGHINIAGYPVRAHRFSFELHHGEIPSGALVTHKCDIPSCVNPDHLALGTNQTNMLDMASRSRGVRSRRGLPYGVHFHDDKKCGRFTASVRYLGKRHHLGSFSSADEAGCVAAQAKEAFLAAEPKEGEGGR